MKSRSSEKKNQSCFLLPSVGLLSNFAFVQFFNDRTNSHAFTLLSKIFTFYASFCVPHKLNSTQPKLHSMFACSQYIYSILVLNSNKNVNQQYTNLCTYTLAILVCHNTNDKKRKRCVHQTHIFPNKEKSMLLLIEHLFVYVTQRNPAADSVFNIFMATLSCLVSVACSSSYSVITYFIGSIFYQL